MEEKQFKCQECDAKFATSEQLQNHNRRHGMRINLSTKASVSSASNSLSTPSFGKGSLSAGVISFVDETPTPTRFIRNCEEVGLFQDLQNVNPFDEDFKKAANGTATPSGEATGFDISFSSAVIGVPGTPNVETGLTVKGSRSKRRYSEQDTLNTPQVFPYFSSTGGCHTLTTNTASMSACLTPTPQASLANENLSGELHPALPADTSSSVNNNNVSTTSYNHEEHVSIIAYTSAISQQTGSGGSTVKLLETPKSAELPGKKSTVTTPVSSSPQGRPSSLKIRSRANLKLDLKTVIIKDKVPSTLSEKVANNQTLSDDDKLTSSTSAFEFSNKRELLERNRAAAHRSRERRKQWIYGLESRCRALEALLAQSQADVARLKAENEALKAQLSVQSNQEGKQQHEDVTILPISDETVVIHQTSQKELQPVIREPLVDNRDGSSELVIVSPIVLPTKKSKRGRPRKGEERRVPILAVPMISASEEGKTLPKIPILPISQAKKSKVV